MSRTRLRFGALSSSKLEDLPLCRPFTQQLDLVFPSSTALENVLSDMSTPGYVKTNSKLANFVELAWGHVNPLIYESDVIAIGYNSPGTDETWCIDTRGVLTLFVMKETYQKLGLMGTKLPWKHCEDRYIIVLAHKLPEQSDKNAKHWNILGPKQKAALDLYDRLRAATGLDSWEVVYHCTKQDVLAPEHELVKVSIQNSKMTDVYIPRPNLSPPSADSKDFEGEMEDWNEYISELYEWVGMACLGAQRLYINDRVDPYVAVYTPPDPSYRGIITHVRYRGLLHPSFVRSVLIAIMTCISSKTLPDAPSFAAITSHSIAISPVGYISSSSSRVSTPLRLPNEDAQDTLSIMFTRDDGSRKEERDCGIGFPVIAEDEKSKCRWSTVEYIDSRDMRWG